jgi:hypothetical protein
MYSLCSLGNPGGLGEAGYVDMQIHSCFTLYKANRKKEKEKEKRKFILVYRIYIFDR